MESQERDFFKSGNNLLHVKKDRMSFMAQCASYTTSWLFVAQVRSNFACLLRDSVNRNKVQRVRVCERVLTYNGEHVSQRRRKGGRVENHRVICIEKKT